MIHFVQKMSLSATHLLQMDEKYLGFSRLQQLEEEIWICHWPWNHLLRISFFGCVSGLAPKLILVADFALIKKLWADHNGCFRSSGACPRAVMRRDGEKMTSGCNPLTFLRWRMIERTLVLWSAAAGCFQVSVESKYLKNWPLQAVWGGCQVGRMQVGLALLPPCTLARVRDECKPFPQHHQPKGSQGPREALSFLIWNTGDHPRTWCGVAHMPWERSAGACVQGMSAQLGEEEG